MITNVSRLQIYSTYISLRPQMVGDIDMVWLLRGFGRFVSEDPIWWFFDNILNTLLNDRFFYIGKLIGSGLLISTLYYKTGSILFCNLYSCTINNTFLKHHIIRTLNISSMLSSQNFNIFNMNRNIDNMHCYKLRIDYKEVTYLYSYLCNIYHNSIFCKNNLNFNNGILLYIKYSTLVWFYNLSKILCIHNIYIIVYLIYVYTVIKHSYWDYLYYTIYNNAFIKYPIITIGHTGSTLYSVEYSTESMMARALLPNHFRQLLSEDWLYTYYNVFYYSYIFSLRIVYTEYTNVVNFFKKYCNTNMYNILNVYYYMRSTDSINRYNMQDRNIICNSILYKNNNFTSSVDNISISGIRFNDTFFIKLYKIYDIFLYSYGKSNYFRGFYFFNKYPKNILNYVNYMRKIYIIIYLYLSAYCNNGIFKPYKFDLLYTKQKVRYTKDYISRLGIHHSMNYISTSMDNKADFKLNRYLKVKIHKFEYYQVIIWNSYIRTLINTYWDVRDLLLYFFYIYNKIRRMYNLYVRKNIKYEYYNKKVIWFKLINNVIHNSNEYYELFLKLPGIFRSYKYFRNYIFQKYLYYFRSLNIFSILVRRVRRYPTLRVRIVRSEPNIYAKVISQFFINNIEVYTSNIYSLNRSYNYSTLNIYKYISAFNSINIPYKKFNTYTGFIKDISNIGNNLYKDYYINAYNNIFYIFKLYKYLLHWYGSKYNIVIFVSYILRKINILLYRYKLLFRLIMSGKIYNNIESLSSKYIICMKKLKYLSELIVQCKFILYIIIVVSPKYINKYTNMSMIKYLKFNLDHVKSIYKSIGVIGYTYGVHTKNRYIYTILIKKIFCYLNIIEYYLGGYFYISSILSIFVSIQSFRNFYYKLLGWRWKLSTVLSITSLDYILINNDLLSHYNYIVKSFLLGDSINLFGRAILYYTIKSTTSASSDDILKFNMMKIHRNSPCELFSSFITSTSNKSTIFTALYGYFINRWYKSFKFYQYSIYMHKNNSFINIVIKISRIYKYLSYIYNFMHSLKIFSLEFSNYFFRGHSFTLSKKYLNMTFIYTYIYNIYILRIRYQLYFYNIILRNKIKCSLLYRYLLSSSNGVSKFNMLYNNTIHKFIPPMRYNFSYYCSYYRYNIYNSVSKFVNIKRHISYSKWWNLYSINFIRYNLILDSIINIKKKKRKKFFFNILLQSLKFDYFLYIMCFSKYIFKAVIFDSILFRIYSMRYIYKCINSYKIYRKNFYLYSSIRTKFPVLRDKIYKHSINILGLVESSNYLYKKIPFYNVDGIKSSLWYVIRKFKRFKNKRKRTQLGNKKRSLKNNKQLKIKFISIYFWNIYIYVYTYSIFIGGLIPKYILIIYLHWVSWFDSVFTILGDIVTKFYNLDIIVLNTSVQNELYLLNINDVYFIRQKQVMMLFGTAMFLGQSYVCHTNIIDVYYALKIYKVIFSNFYAVDEYLNIFGFFALYTLGNIDYVSTGDNRQSINNMQISTVLDSYNHKLLLHIYIKSIYFMLGSTRYTGISQVVKASVIYVIRILKLQIIMLYNSVYRTLFLSNCLNVYKYVGLVVQSYKLIRINKFINLFSYFYIYVVYNTSYIFLKVHNLCCRLNIYNIIYIINYLYTRSYILSSICNKIYNRIYKYGLLTSRIYKIHKTYYIEGDLHNYEYRTTTYKRNIQNMLSYVYNLNIVGCTKLYRNDQYKILSSYRHWRHFLYAHTVEFRRNRYIYKYIYNQVPRQMSADWSGYMVDGGLWANEYWYNLAIHDRTYMNTMLEYCNMFKIFNRIYMPLLFEDFIFIFLLYMFHRYINNYILTIFMPTYTVYSINYFPQIFTNEDYMDPPIIDPDFVCKYIKTAIRKEDTLYEAISEVRVWISRSIHRFKTFSYFYRKGFRNKIVNYKLDYRTPLVRSVKIEISGRVNERRRTIVRMYKVGWKVTTSRVKDRPLQYSSTQGQSKYGVFGIKVWVFLHHQPVRGYVK